MTLITVEDLLKRVSQAEKEAPRLIKAGLQASKLAEINQDNLLHGKDSEGGLMPPYSREYRQGNTYYRAYKMRSNPYNQGRWDLKHWWNKKYDGLFYKSIKVKVTLKDVTFSTNYDPGYMKEIYWYKSKKKILGVTKQQFIEVQIRNIPRVKPSLLNIINKGK